MKTGQEVADHTLQELLFELILNLASLQPITEDVMKRKSRVCGQTPTLIITHAFTLPAPDFSDAP